jgi:hypothetical protein
LNRQSRIRFRFSLKALLAFITLVSLGIGGWKAYSLFRIKKLEELRQQGVIVILRDRTPQALQSIGLKQLSPFFDVPTIELYVTPLGADAQVGDSQSVVPNSTAEQSILEQARIARSYGAKDLQLGILGEWDNSWGEFAFKNSLSPIGDSRECYLKRLRANQESGANINP